MSRNISGLRRTAGPGRPKGSKNKATREIKEWVAKLMGSVEWQDSAKERILAGKAPHLEAHCLQVAVPKTTKHEHEGVITLEHLVAGAGR